MLCFDIPELAVVGAIATMTMAAMAIAMATMEITSNVKMIFFFIDLKCGC